ncbi:MAG: hypothetical protein WC494_02810 [Candidatus Pacearchaeota archaeon]
MNIDKDTKPENYFFLADGKVIKNVVELTEVLNDMPSWVFEHHVTKDKNDFSNWIRDVYLEGELAKNLAKKKRIKQIKATLEKALRKEIKKKRKLEKILRKEESKKINPPKKKIKILKLLKNNNDKNNRDYIL